MPTRVINETINQPTNAELASVVLLFNSDGSPQAVWITYRILKLDGSLHHTGGFQVEYSDLNSTNQGRFDGIQSVALTAVINREGPFV